MILNQQTEVSVAVPQFERFLMRVKKSLGVIDLDLGICFVTTSEIRRLNRTYRAKNKPTDVLSFPFWTSLKGRNRKFYCSNGAPSYLGDIAISPAIARRNAIVNGRTLQIELRILIIHGVLHLLGFDHERDQGEMSLVEGQLRHQFGIH